MRGIVLKRFSSFLKGKKAMRRIGQINPNRLDMETVQRCIYNGFSVSI